MNMHSDTCVKSCTRTHTGLVNTLTNSTSFLPITTYMTRGSMRKALKVSLHTYICVLIIHKKKKI